MAATKEIPLRNQTLVGLREYFLPCLLYYELLSKFLGPFISLPRNKLSNSFPLNNPFGLALWEHDIPCNVSTNRSEITTYIATVIGDRCSLEERPVFYVTGMNSDQISEVSFY